MKLFFAFIISLAFVLAPQAFAASGKMSQATRTTLQLSTMVTADALSSAVDLSAYDGPVMIVLNSAAAESGKTIDFAIHHATSSAGSYAAVSGGSFTQVTSSASSQQSIILNKDSLRQFIKLNIDVSSSFSGSGSAVSAAIIGFKKYR